VAVLSHPIAWRRLAKRDVEADLSVDEQACVRRALRFLAKRHGTYAKLAASMKAKPATVMLAARSGTVSAGIALKAARVAKAPLEDVLAGRWPKPSMCPLCGRE
jgi:hypothetical protein